MEDETVAAVRAFNRFYTRFAGVLAAHYMDSELSLAEARLIHEIANRDAPVATELQDVLGLDAGYVSRMLRRFQAQGWIARGRGADARRRPIALTASGRAVYEALNGRVHAATAARIARLGPAERAELIAALRTAMALLGGGVAQSEDGA